jgi:hypothetical protein
MAGTFFHKMLYAAQSVDLAQRLPIWILTGILAVAILYGLWKSLKLPLSLHKKEIQWWL